MGGGRGGPTDAAWARIGPPLARGDGPEAGGGAITPQVISGIQWRLRAGAPWRGILNHVPVKDDAIGKVKWTFPTDSATVAGCR